MSQSFDNYDHTCFCRVVHTAQFLFENCPKSFEWIKIGPELKCYIFQKRHNCFKFTTEKFLLVVFLSTISKYCFKFIICFPTFQDQ